MQQDWSVAVKAAAEQRKALTVCDRHGEDEFRSNDEDLRAIVVVVELSRLGRAVTTFE